MNYHQPDDDPFPLTTSPNRISEEDEDKDSTETLVREDIEK